MQKCRCLLLILYVVVSHGLITQDLWQVNLTYHRAVDSKSRPYYLPPYKKLMIRLEHQGTHWINLSLKGQTYQHLSTIFCITPAPVVVNIIRQIHPCCLGLPLNMLLGVNRKGETIRWVGGVARTGVKRVGFAPSSSLLVPTSRSGEERRQTFQSCPPAAPAA